MNRSKVVVIYSDDGCDVYPTEEGEVRLGEMGEVVEEVKGELEKEGFEVRAVPLREPREEGLRDFIREVSESREHIIFNLCEGAFDDSSNEMNVAALLELYGLRFTGSGPLTLGLAVDKALTKAVLRGNGISTPGHFVAEGVPVSVPGSLRFPLIVKPLREDASIGIEHDAVVATSGDLEKRVDYVLTNYAQPAIVEEYVDGREFSVSILGNGHGAVTLPPTEIDYSAFPEGMPRICCYEAKWVTSSPLYKKTPPLCPAPVSGALKRELEELALRAYRAVGCRDYGRVDMRLGPDGLKVLEVTPNPDISSDAGLARAARACGMSYSKLLAEIVRIAEARFLKEDSGG